MKRRCPWACGRVFIMTKMVAFDNKIMHAAAGSLYDTVSVYYGIKSMFLMI